MLLTADVGNTEIVIGVFDGAELRHTWRSSTRPERTSDELALLLSGFLEHREIDLRTDDHGLVRRERRARRDEPVPRDGAATSSTSRSSSAPA